MPFVEMAVSVNMLMPLLVPVVSEGAAGGVPVANAGIARAAVIMSARVSDKSFFIL